jgi:hypothetical protein
MGEQSRLSTWPDVNLLKTVTTITTGSIGLYFCIIKLTRCTNFSNLFFEWKSTCFGQFLCPSSGVFNRKHSNGICHTVLQTAWEQDQVVPSSSCSQAVCKIVRHIPLLCVQWKTPDDGQRNCPKHVDFHSKNKFEKLVRLVGFIIQIYHDARSHHRQIDLHVISSVNSICVVNPVMNHWIFYFMSGIKILLSSSGYVISNSVCAVSN